MASQQAISVNKALFDPAAIPAGVTAFNEQLMQIGTKNPKWWIVGAAKYRAMRKAGETVFPATQYLDNIQEIQVPSRDPARTIPCSIYVPQSAAPKAVYMHIHGGGWVLGDHRSHDSQQQRIANENNVTCISVGYRLAPEHPFPAGPEDCYDVAEWLVSNAEKELGAALGFVGGESAGGHLSMLVALHLLQHAEAKFRDFAFKGLILHYGCFDLTATPSVRLFKKPQTLVLDHETYNQFGNAFVPDYPAEKLKDPKLSPLYADLASLRGRLPPAFFAVGTEDCLLDDTVFMSTKYLMNGGEAEVLVVPGAFHGFSALEGVKGSQSEIAQNAATAFMQKYM